MEIFAKLFGKLLVFVYHCFDRIVVNGYLSGFSRPEQVVYFFREVGRREGGRQGDPSLGSMMATSIPLGLLVPGIYDESEDGDLLSPELKEQ